MYRNVFRGSHANGLEVCKKADIIEKKAHNKSAPAVDTEAVARLYKSSSMEATQHVRNRAPRVGVTKKV